MTVHADFGKVAVLMGGNSAERDISIKSGQATLQALLAMDIDAHGVDAADQLVKTLLDGQFDRVFIALHGRGGEDGSVQGLLEMMGLPYTGSGVLASALSMDKIKSKQLMEGAGIRTPKFIEMVSGQAGAADLQAMELPIIIKPVCEGSSFGMSIVHDPGDVEAALAAAYKYDHRVLAEQYIEGGEYTAAIVADLLLPLIKVETPQSFYDYEAKYVLNSTQYHCPCGLSMEDEESIQNIARQTFDLIGCRGWGRVDFMMDQAGTPYVLEINTVPGLTDHSLVPIAAEKSGLGFNGLILKILEGSHVQRH